MNAVSPIACDTDEATLPELVLRVLIGRNKDAEHVLPQNRRLRIGHSFENDIVLRHETTKGHSLELTTCGRRAVVNVLSDQIEVLGRSFGEGERITLEPYIPVAIGAIVFAIGGADEERWREAAEALDDDQMTALARAPEAPRTDVRERVDMRSAPLRRKYAERLLSPLMLAVIGGVCLAIAGGTFAGTTLLAPTAASPREVGSELAELGYPHLYVERSADGTELSVAGLVASDQDLLKLHEWAREAHPDLAMGVATVQSAGESATNLLAAQGVDAAVVPLGADGLAIESEFLPQDRQRELEAMLRADLPRVRRFTFSRSAMRGEQDLAYFFNAPGFGAASFVSGDPSFIVTEDGTRWFVGANLPTGHTIVDIADQKVIVEREGLRDTLIM